MLSKVAPTPLSVPCGSTRTTRASQRAETTPICRPENSSVNLSDSPGFRSTSVRKYTPLALTLRMDEHVKLAEELFSAAKTEFKHLEFFYFHNCLYDFVWKDNRRRHSERTRTWELLHKYGHDYKVIFVGDATMREA